MSWATTGLTTASWATGAVASATFTTYTQDLCPPAWAQVTSIQTEADGGVDFRLCASDQFPMRACEDRAIYALEVTGGEGLP